MTAARGPASREAIVAALFALLTAGNDFRMSTRRMRRPQSIPAAQTPALVLVEPSERQDVPALGQPNRRHMMLRAIVYVDSGSDENAVPAALLNPILDRFDALLGLDPARGPQTLGGLVQSARIDGTVLKAPGDLTGKGLAAVPITILLP